jgi:hypothetical protein
MSLATERHQFFADKSRSMREFVGVRDRGHDFYQVAYDAYASEAQRDIALEEAEDQGELLDLRFIGPNAQHGFMPLHQFIDIVTPLEKALNSTARRLRSGNDASKKDDKTRDALGMKLAGMADGSARVLVLGDARPDITGTSIFTQTMEQAFRLLNSPNDDFYDAVDAVGGVAANLFGEALQETDKHGLAAEFSWQPARQPLVIWRGTPDEIRRVSALIDTTKEQETFEQTISGVVAAMADNGKITLRIGEAKEKIRFPLNLLHSVQRLVLAQPIMLTVSTTRYWDAILKRDVMKHTLTSVIDSKHH